MNNLPSLGQTTHVPVPEPTVPTDNAVAADRDTVLTNIADAVSPTGDVDTSALDRADDNPNGGVILTEGEIELEGADPYAAQVRRVAHDTDLTDQERITRLLELSETNRDLARPEQKARLSLLSLEEEGAEDFVAARRAAVVGDEIIKANTMRQIIDSTKASLDSQFDETGYVATAERTTEFIASELLPTGWVKSGHYDPAKLLTTLVPELDVDLLDHAVLGSKLDEARAIFQDLEPEEQIRRARDMERVINQIQGTFGTDNKFEADRLHQVFAGIVGDLKEYDQARMVTFIEPLVNVATLGIGTKVIKAVKGVVKSSPLKISAEIAPQSADKLVRAAAEDATGKTAQDLGTSRAEVLEDYAMFNDKDEPILRGPDLVTEDPVVSKAVEDITRIRSQHNLASDSEIASASPASEKPVTMW